jgi:hypothetical protein
MKMLGLVTAAIGLVVLIGLILSLPVMLLWNYCLVGAINGVNEIGWMQAWGILILAGLLFKTHVTNKD